MVITQTSSKKQKHKHLKRKERFRTQVDFGTPQVLLYNKQPNQKQELLSDWEDAP